MVPIYLAGAVRTPIGRFGGAFSTVPSPLLGAAAGREALSRAGLSPERIAESIFGCARQAGVGPNPGRQISRLVGIPDTAPAFTVNQACASGLKAILLAAQSVALGEADPVLAGGAENMSRVPYILTGGRFGYRMGNGEMADGMTRDGFFCPLCQQLMGETAENLAREYRISREEQDRYAVESQRRCQEAREGGLFQEEIVSLEIPGPRGPTLRIESDEHPRAGVTVEDLSHLPAVFADSGTVI